VCVCVFGIYTAVKEHTLNLLQSSLHVMKA